MEHYLALFYPDLATVFDYLPKDSAIALDHLARDARDERLAMIADAYDARSNTERKVHYHPLEPSRLYLDAEEWDAAAGRAGHAPVLIVQRGRGRGGHRHGCAGRAQLRRRAQAGQRQPVRGHGRPRAEAVGGRQAGAVRLVVGRLVGPADAHAGRPRPERRCHWPPYWDAARSAANPKNAAAGGVAAGRRVRDRQPRRSSSRPTSWASIGWPGPASAAAPRTSWPRPRRSPRATWWSTSTTASAATRA